MAPKSIPTALHNIAVGLPQTAASQQRPPVQKPTPKTYKPCSAAPPAPPPAGNRAPVRPPLQAGAKRSQANKALAGRMTALGRLNRQTLARVGTRLTFATKDIKISMVGQSPAMATPRARSSAPSTPALETNASKGTRKPRPPSSVRSTPTLESNASGGARKRPTPGSRSIQNEKRALWRRIDGEGHIWVREEEPQIESVARKLWRRVDGDGNVWVRDDEAPAPSGRATRSQWRKVDGQGNI